MIVVSFRRLTPSFQSATAHQETKSRLTSREVVYELETGLLADAAAYGEHSADQQSSRNGSLERLWETRAGAVNVKIPKLRSGSYSPPLAGPTSGRGLMENFTSDFGHHLLKALVDPASIDAEPMLVRDRSNRNPVTCCFAWP